MLHRFVAGSAVASVAIAIGATAILLVSPATMTRFYPVVHLWCLIPAVWGVWMMVTPRSWMPHRLPMWGAILGLILGFNGAFLLNVPGRILGTTTPAWARIIGLIVATVAYYLLWMVVRKVYLILTMTTKPERERGKATAA